MENGDLPITAPSTYSDDEVDKAIDAALAAVERQSKPGGEKKKWRTFRYPPDEAEILMAYQPTPFPKMPEVSPEFEAKFSDTISELRATWARCTERAERSDMHYGNLLVCRGLPAALGVRYAKGCRRRSLSA
jgi:hypothetical protein